MTEVGVKFSENMSASDMTQMLQCINETFTGYNLDLTNDADWRSMIGEPETRQQYERIIAEGLAPEDAKKFEVLCENISQFTALNESNTSAGFLPQAKLVMPLFRFMWPRLIMKEFVNVVPMDSPEIVRYFFRPMAIDASGNQISLPSYSSIGMGVSVGTYDSPCVINVPNTGSSDIKNLITQAGLTSATATVSRGVVFTTWTGLNASGTAVSGTIEQGQVDEEGKFSFTIEVDSASHVTDTVSGHINFETGDIVVSGLKAAAAASKISTVGLMAVVSTAEYNTATKITFDPKKIRFTTEDMQLQAEWSLQWEQDQRARMGLDVQAEFISVFGNQIQLNIDSLMLNDIIYNVQKYNASNIEQFTRQPSRAAFAGTRKLWAEELLLKIENVSAQIYNDTNLMPASHIVINPKDVVWLKMLNNFDFKGYFDKNGQMGSSPVIGSFQNSYTVLASPIVPSGTIIIGAKPAQDSFANYMFAPYVPIILNPYPLGQRPAMTVTSRFARKMLRPEGFGLVQLLG